MNASQLDCAGIKIKNSNYISILAWSFTSYPEYDEFILNLGKILIITNSVMYNNKIRPMSDVTG